VVGYGKNVALALMDPIGRQAFNAQFPANGPAAAIGDTPPQFNPRVEAYRHMDILKMIVFYNQNFDIQAQDDLPERVNKFRRFLAEY
jgi:hypothetical protein